MPQLAQKHGKRTNKSPKELYLLLKIFKKQIQTTASETVSVLNFLKNWIQTISQKICIRF